MHLRVGDEPEVDGDAVLPASEGFVVGGGDDFVAAVDPGDGVDGFGVALVGEDVGFFGREPRVPLWRKGVRSERYYQICE